MALPTDQSPYWDRVARSKAFSHPVSAGRLGEHVERSVRLLEIGCGYGRVLEGLHREGWSRTIGLDTSAAMIERGRRSFPHLDLRYHSDGPLPFDDETFGAVLLVSVLTCIPAPAAQEGLLAEAERMLRAGGVLFVSDLLLQDDERNRERYTAGRDRYGVEGVFELPEGVTLCHFPRSRLATLTKRFETLRSDELEVTTMNGNAARAFQLLARKPG